MQEKVEASGKYLFVFLLVHAAATFLSFLFSCIETLAEDVYLEYVLSIDIVVDLFAYIVYWMMLILYLVWIWRLHKEYRQLAPNYPVTPGGALARILIPFYSIVGMWTVYSIMARFLRGYDEMTARYGMRIRFLIPFYYFAHVLSSLVTRLAASQEGAIWYVWMTGSDLLATLSYLAMFVAVSAGLRAVREHQQQMQSKAEENTTDTGEPGITSATPGETTRA
ncbi:hypothetical protein ACAF76_002440 [Brevibacillus sp. TJ4]|uniref:hypothetical protein n=1 Tax=Brevibacillus sp. TJ4 TaxID=3234853 RepID=UPI0037D5A084